MPKLSSSICTTNRQPSTNTNNKLVKKSLLEMETETLASAELELIEQRRGRERNGKPIGRYFMCVQVRAGMAQVGAAE